MFKLSGSTVCILIALLVIIGGAFAVGPWVMEWYALDPVQGTGSHANGIEVDWIEDLFGMTEAELAKGFPDPAMTGTKTIQGEDGDISYAAGTYTVKSGGADIWGNADAFRFTYKEMSGDFEIALKAESIEQTNDWAKIGPMVRQTNAPESQYLFMLARAVDGNKYFQERMDEGGSASGNGGSIEDAAGFPIWLKITRSGDDFTGAVSDDGSTWADVGTTTLALTDPVLVGLAVTSHSTGDITTAVASELTIDGVDPEFAGTSEDIGTVKTETTELGWRVGNLADVNNDRNLSAGIYESEYGADMSNFVFYGFIGVISPTAQDTVMNVAQDDQLKVWINGELAATDTSWTGGATTTRPHDVHLDAGVNIVLVKVAEEGGGDYLNVQFDAENLTFIPKDGQIDWSTSVSPAGKFSSTWGGIKSR